MRSRRILWLYVGAALLLPACNLGPMLFPTATPTLTFTPSSTPTSTATETPTPTLTFTPPPTPTATPTAVTCPKGTMREPITNRCIYVTRTPKPEETYCAHFTHKWACINNNCSWDGTNKVCS